MPHLSIVNGFKGVIDFFVWKGMPLARSWPRYRPHTVSPAEAATQVDFAYANRLLPTLPPVIRDAYVAQVVGVPYRWSDLAVQAYISGIRYTVVAP